MVVVIITIAPLPLVTSMLVYPETIVHGQCQLMIDVASFSQKISNFPRTCPRNPTKSSRGERLWLDWPPPQPSPYGSSTRFEALTSKQHILINKM
jgi:hypothetical protein